MSEKFQTGFHFLLKDFNYNFTNTKLTINGKKWQFRENSNAFQQRLEIVEKLNVGFVLGHFLSLS